MDPTIFTDLLTPIRWPLTVIYLSTLLLLCVFGVHRYWLTLTYYRTRRHIHRPQRRFRALPRVTIQLPIFNERFVAERVIESACAVDYPARLLQIQVLDDSTDACAQVVRQCVERLKAADHEIELIHRRNRCGYKAGALQNGLATATGELIAVFDADFVVPRNFLKRTVHHFTDGQIGCVQACWEHLNRETSLLTRSQAIYLDGHFLIEHVARNRSGRWMNFNGTAGIWRREAIEDAGGWQADTLTEDVDLSYRAQLAGWRFVFLPRVQCPAELPPETGGFKSQQRRWAKGSIQVGRKLIGRIWGAAIPLRVKLEATFHLFSPLVYPAMVVTLLLTLPALLVNLQPFADGPVWGWLFGLTLFVLATASGASFYIAGQIERRRPILRDLLCMPIITGIGIGVALSNAWGVIEALIGRSTPFIRTPKYSATSGDSAWRARRRFALPVPHLQVSLEMLLAGYLTLGTAIACRSLHGLATVPFLAIFAGGYWYVALTSLNLRAVKQTSTQ